MTKHGRKAIFLSFVFFSISSSLAYAWTWPAGTACSGGSFSGAGAGQLCCATPNGDVCQAKSPTQDRSKIKSQELSKKNDNTKVKN